ncbi:MAG: hypothetical protein H7234_07460 [Herminiimonas sp.]|nr:hypothetical protein [Herminiimonas sp.]
MRVVKIESRGTHSGALVSVQTIRAGNGPIAYRGDVFTGRSIVAQKKRFVTDAAQIIAAERALAYLRFDAFEIRTILQVS